MRSIRMNVLQLLPNEIQVLFESWKPFQVKCLACRREFTPVMDKDGFYRTKWQYKCAAGIHDFEVWI